jgi:hypothetical protein
LYYIGRSDASYIFSLAANPIGSSARGNFSNTFGKRIHSMRLGQITQFFNLSLFSVGH